MMGLTEFVAVCGWKVAPWQAEFMQKIQRATPEQLRHVGREVTRRRHSARYVKAVDWMPA